MVRTKLDDESLYSLENILTLKWNIVVKKKMVVVDSEKIEWEPIEQSIKKMGEHQPKDVPKGALVKRARIIGVLIIIIITSIVLIKRRKWRH